MIDSSAPPPRYTGLLGFGGRTAGVDTSSTNLDYHMIFGKRAFFGYKVTEQGRTDWFANLPHHDLLTRAQARTVPPEKWLHILDEAFASDRTPATELLAHSQPADLIVIGGLEIMPTAPVWSRGRTVLVGDAAHVPSPSSGQGAALAIEGAVELARCRVTCHLAVHSPHTRIFGVVASHASSNSPLAPTVTRRQDPSPDGCAT